MAGSYAYVADADAGLRVIDVDTPSAPFEVGLRRHAGRAHAVAVAGGYAYVADDAAGLRVIDVSTPSTPVEVGSVDTPGTAWDVAVSGSYAYVADVDGGPSGDQREHAVSAGRGWLRRHAGLAWGVAVVGRLRLRRGRDAGLRVIDVSTPSAPVEVGFVETPGGAVGVAVAGGYAYVADGGPRACACSTCATPSAPVEVGFVDTPGWATDSRCRGATPMSRTRRGPSGDRREHAVGAGGGWLRRHAGRGGVSRWRAATPTSRTLGGSAGDRREHAVGAGRGGLPRHAGRARVSRCRAPTPTSRRGRRVFA